MRADLPSEFKSSIFMSLSFVIFVMSCFTKLAIALSLSARHACWLLVANDHRLLFLLNPFAFHLINALGNSFLKRFQLGRFFVIIEALVGQPEELVESR